MSNTWKAVIGVVLIFVFGWMAGAISASLYIQHKTQAVLQGGPATLAKAVERRLTRGLDLDANQKQQIYDSFVKNITQRIELQKTIQPQIRTLNQETFAEVNTVLKPEQQKKFRENVEQFRDRFGKNPFNPGTNQAAGPATNDAVGLPPAAH